MRPLLVCAALFTACGGTPASSPAPVGSGPPSSPSPSTPDRPATEVSAAACSLVVTEDDAKAIFAVAQGIAAPGDCAFDGLQAQGSVITVTFAAKTGEKAPSTLQPLACAAERPAGAVSSDPWLLDVPADSRQRCPDAYASLVEAVVGGRLPSPSPAK
jgi:hypothetical protein